MKILIVTATAIEIDPLTQHLQTGWNVGNDGMFHKGACSTGILVTGVGIHRMAFAMGRELVQPQYDLYVNAGIAGVYPGKGTIGDVVHVTNEVFADLGAEDADGNFLDLVAMGIAEDISSVHGLTNAQAAPYGFLPPARGVTVNKTHGSRKSIQTVIDAYDPDVESMEGGAFFYCCLKAQVSFIEIRSVSNLVEPRNKNHWDIPLAVERLNRQLLELLNFFAE